ncbi:head-tail connector protein [Methylobacterium sp. JK268]
MLRYRRETAPAGAVVGLERARAHLRLEEADRQDALIAAALAAAVEQLDGTHAPLRHALLTQVWEATGDAPGPCGIPGATGFLLDLAPVQAVLSVEILVRGALTALPPDSWRLLFPLRRRCAALVPAPGATWPEGDPDPAAWRIRFRAGYGETGEAVPEAIKAAILLLATDLFETRDAKQFANVVENPTVARLLAPYGPSEA